MSNTDYPRDHRAYVVDEEPGITKRELYAAHALVGFLASGHQMNGTQQGGAEDAALFCWRMADAMIATADDPPTTERADNYRAGGLSGGKAHDFSPEKLDEIRKKAR